MNGCRFLLVIFALFLFFAGCLPKPDYKKRAEEEFCQNDFLGCILELNLLFEQQQADDSMLVLRAYCYNRVEKHEKAEADLKEALRLNPESMGARLEYARLMAYRGDTIEALRMLAIPQGQLNRTLLSGYLIEKAKLLFYTKRYAESLDMLNKAIEADSANAEAWFFRGAYYASGLTEAHYSPERAIHDYQKAIKQKPGFAEAYYKLALTEIDDLADFSSGINHLSLAISLDPYNSEYYLERAKRYMVLENVNAAIADYQKILKLNPLDSTALLNLRLLR